MKLLVIEGSTRTVSSTMSHVQTLIDHQVPSVISRVIRLRDYELPLFRDVRPDSDWPSSEALLEIFQHMLHADLIIVASPLYWYSVSGLMKNFIDHWLSFMKSPELVNPEFLEGKYLFPLIVGSEGSPREDAEPAFLMLRLSGDYLGAKLLEGFMGEGDRSGQAIAESLLRIATVDLTAAVQKMRTS